MAGQSLFCRTLSLFNGSKMILANRINHVNFTPTCKGFKQNIKDFDKSKIPEKPKKPLTAFFNFMIEKRPKLLKENTALSPQDLVRKLSEEWKSLSSAAKEKYQEQAKKDRTIYEQKILSYAETLTPELEITIKEMEKEKREEKMKRRLKKKCREEHRPKKPTSSFGIFIHEHSSKAGNRGEKSFIEFSKELKDLWAKMPDAEKNKYKVEYEKNREQFEKEMAVWEAKMIALGNENLVRTKTLKEHYSKEKGTKKNKHE